MKAILRNSKSVVVFTNNTYWYVTAALQIGCLNEASESYGHNEVKASFVKMFGEPTEERKPGGKPI